MRALLVAVLLCVSFGAASQGPTARHDSKPNVEQQPAHNERGSTERPLVVVLKEEQPTPAKQTAAEEERQEKTESLSYERTLAIWTVVLSVATVLLMVFTAALFFVTFRIAGDSAKTAKNAILQSRAYLGPSASRAIGVDADRPFEIITHIKNTGTTSARNVLVWCDMAVSATEPTPEMFATRRLQKLDFGTIQPTQAGQVSLVYDGKTLTPEQSAQIKAGALGVYVHGRIEYDLVFDEPRQIEPISLTLRGPGLVLAPDGLHMLSKTPNQPA